MWGLAAPLPVYLSLTLLGFSVYGAWVLFSRHQNQGQVAAKTQVRDNHSFLGHFSPC